MRLPCTVKGKTAFIVGYCPGSKGRVHAIVVCEARLRAVRLKDIELGEVPPALSPPAGCGASPRQGRFEVLSNPEDKLYAS